MKLYKDVLRETTLHLINRELTNFMESGENWTCSNFKWKSNVKVNIAGTTMTARVSEGIVQLILDDLKDILPPISHTDMMYFVWTPNSGISTHNDAMYKFGATIYLNDLWDINDGGIFMYHVKDSEWSAHVPTFNTMMINDDKNLHMVTPVSPFARNNRYTLQIFGDKESGY